MTSQFLPDTSPLFDYGQRWQAGYARRADGYDQTYHSVSNATAYIYLNLTTTSFGFSTSTTTSCPLEYSINASSYVSACPSGSSSASISNLPFGAHQLRVRTATTDSVQFYGIAASAPLPDGTYTNSTLDNTDPAFTWSDGWTHLVSDGTRGTVANATVVGEYDDRSGFYNSSASISTAQGSSVELHFAATAVYLYGMSGPAGGEAAVWLDDVLMNNLSLVTPWNAYSSLLFVQSGMNDTTSHTLRLINSVPGKELLVDYAILTRPVPKSSPKSNLTAIASGVSAGVAVLLIATVILYLVLTRRKPPRTPRTQYAFSTGVASSSSRSPKSWKSWTKHAASASPAPSTASSGRAHSAAAEDWAMPPTYPDYIPYQSPRRSPPPEDVSRWSAASSVPPGVVGATPGAAGWLVQSRDAQAHLPPSARQPQEPARTPSTANITLGGKRLSPGRDRDRLRPPPLARRGTRDKYDDISLGALSSAYTGTGTATPSPSDDASGIFSPTTPSSVLQGVTVRAGLATRSVARIWSSHPTGNNSSSSAPNSTYDRPSTSPRPPLAVFPPSSYSHHPNSSFSQSTSAFATGSGSGSPCGRHTPTTDYTRSNTPFTPSSSERHTLRRGVSIKSVKTMRSFFSALLHGVPTPDAPALPQPAARPDSGIFPITAAVSRSNSVQSHLPSASTTDLRSSPARDPPPLAIGGRPAYAGFGQGRPMGLDLSDAGRAGGNMIIELSPESPITTFSRPESRW